MNRPDLLALRDAVRQNIQGGADLLSERRMLRLLDALLSEGNVTCSACAYLTATWKKPKLCNDHLPPGRIEVWRPGRAVDSQSAFTGQPGTTNTLWRHAQPDRMCPRCSAYIERVNDGFASACACCGYPLANWSA